MIQGKSTAQKGLGLVVTMTILLCGSSAVMAQRPLGIDVSQFQSTIDWNAVYASGIQFAFIRASHGSLTDTKFLTNIVAAKNAGILAGCYHYATPVYDSAYGLASQDPVTAATMFVNVAGPYISGGYLRPVLDLELGGGQTPNGATSLAAWAQAWITTVKNLTGVDAMIYANTNYATSYLGTSLTSYPLWLANWTQPSNPLTASPPTNADGAWSTWTFWQYTSSGSVSGISGNVDRDVFNGTRAQLETYLIPDNSEPPVISGVTVSSLGTSSATITWTTDVASTTQVQYGPTSSYGYTSTLNSNMVTSHSATLSSLSASTLYHYRVLSTNTAGTTYSSDYTFTTIGPPVISNVQATNITTTTATITWTTNTASNSQVRYGVNSSYETTSSLNTSMVTSHSITLTGLTPSTLYNYQVVSANSNGTSSSIDYTFTTDEVSAPIISNVAATGITASLATIAWTTDAASTSQVEYGLTSSYGTSSTLNSTLVTSHAVTISGLAANTLYHYRVISASSDGMSTSSDYTFTTAGPPTISSVQATSITTSGATLTWSTNAAASSQVRYGLTSSYGSTTTLDSTLLTSHSVTLTGLTADTLYHYQVVSGNSNGTTYSSDYTFTTVGVPVISAVAASSVTSGSATITWTTNTVANSQVEYGTTSSYGFTTSLNTTAVTSHSETLSGLAASTLYHYRVCSANSAGTTCSSDFTFTTAAVVTEIIVDNTDAGWANTSPNGNSWITGSNSAVPKIGTNYLYVSGVGSSDKSAATRTCTWTPTLPQAGYYDVQAYYQMGTNRTSSASYEVFYDGGSITSIQNQYSSTSNTGGWFVIGENLPFAAGSTGYVSLGNNTADTAIVSADAIKFVFKNNDSTPPSVPAGLTATAQSQTAIQLTWNASTDNFTISGYRVYRNGTLLSDVSATSYTDNSGTANTTYSYQVSAYDTVGNESAKCTALSGTTLSVPPTSSSATPSMSTLCGSGSVTWTATGGFGVGKIAYYRYAWDQSATHSFTGSETQWSAGTISTTLTATGTWYLHLRGYNSANVANGTCDYAVTANATTSFTLQPVAQSFCPGTTIQFTVAATGTGTVSYVWRKNSTTLSDDGHYSGVYTNTLTINDADANDVGNYRCMATASCGSVTSTAAALTLNQVVKADLNSDCAVDETDLTLFEACKSGAQIAYDPAALPSGCSLQPDGEGFIDADIDRDGDVDQSDFGLFQRCLSGPLVLPDANCAN